MTEDHPTQATEPVHLTVHALPVDVAEQIREVQTRNPELLRQILMYGITHKAIFETLSRSWLA